MATRQNRKKKGRASQFPTRERTVTTLTEDPTSPFLVPTPTEEPAAPGGPMSSSPFSVASSSGGGPNNTNPSTTSTTPNGNLQISGNYGYSYNSNGNGSNINYNGASTPQGQHQQFYQSVTLPPGRNDMEILENLKAQIKSGQHDRFQPKPAPAALLQIYQDGIMSEAAPHPQQGTGYSQHDYDVRSAAPSDTGSKTAFSHDASRRVPRIQTKDVGDTYGPRRSRDSSPVGGPQATIKSNPASQAGNRYGNNTSSNVPPSPMAKPNNDPRIPMDSKAPVNGSAGSGSDIAQPAHSRYNSGPAHDPRAQDINNSKIDRRPPGDSPVGEYGSRPRAASDVSPVKPPFHDGKGDPRPAPNRDSWQSRDGPPAHDDKRARPEPDRPGAPPSGRPPVVPDARPLASDVDIRGAPPRDQRFYDRERDRERERERDRERDRDWDRDRERRPEYRRDDRPGDRPIDRPGDRPIDRPGERPVDRPMDRPRLTDMRRPPPDQRHYEPRYASDLPPRRNDIRPADDSMDVDKRPPLAGRPASLDDRSGRPPPVDDHSRRPPPVDDHSRRLPPVDDRPVRPPVEDRAPLARVPPNDLRPARVAPPDDRHVRPPPSEIRHAPISDDRGLRPLPPLQSQDVPPRLAADRGAPRAPVPPVDDRNTRPPVPLEDRIGRPPPSLQERITHPPVTRAPAARADERLTRPPSLEDRISHPPAGGDRVPLHDDRAVRPGVVDRTVRPADPIRPPPVQDDRVGRPDDRSVRPPPPGDRYVRPVTPLHDRVPPRGVAHPAPGSVSVARDDPRSHRPPSPPPGRDYRPPRALSRERDLRPGHRPENDRVFDDRRPELMDTDPPARFNDTRSAYVRRPSPPLPAADRTRSVYPPPPSPPRAAEPSSYGEVDRRYPAGGERRDWPHDGRPRQASGPDEDYYKTRPPAASWDREGVDRDRVERGAAPTRNNGWETREERERRSSFTGPASPAARPFESAQARPLTSRLSDTYTGPAEDRAYPPKEFDRPRYPSATETATPFSRVRARSPSPISRRPVSGGVADDGRPPLKRAREDVPYSSTPGYYSPDRRASGVVPANDYPSRAAPPSRAVNEPPYYDARDTRAGPPASAGGGRAVGAPYDRDRDYPVARDRAPDVGGYVPGPASYDRPRSPPSSRLPPPAYANRAAYSRGDPRDDRAYMPPPPARNN